jgi:putative FmdB family regulatory protein
MPIYEFRCNACGERFSEFYRSMQRAREGVNPPCPHCQSTQTLRVMSAFAVHGPAGSNPEAAPQTATEQRGASVTTREQINSWRNAKKTP